MKLKNNLDEMQEQKLKQIEHTGFWLFFWGIFLAMMIQFAFINGSLKYAAGEAAVFFPVSIWVAVQCLRNGIWDRRLKADPKTNLLVSLAGGLIAGIFCAIPVYRNFGSVAGALATLVIAFLFTAFVCFVTLSLTASAYKKKVRAMETEPESEEV